MATLNVETLTAPAIEVPAEPTTPMKPSEALRLGRLLRPERLTGSMGDGDQGACALGAMGIAVGVDIDAQDYDGLFRALPDLERVVAFPGGVTALWAGVMTRNDSHRWSDDQIVAWLQDLGL